MPPTRRRRLLAAAAGFVAVAAATGAGVNLAYADDAFVDLAVEVPSVVTSAQSSGKDVRVEIHNFGTATATGVTVDFALPAAADAGFVSVTDDFAANCELADNALSGSCEVADVPGGAVVNLKPFTIHPGELAADDDSRIGAVRVAVSSDQADLDFSDNKTSAVARIGAEASADLVVWPHSDLTVRPGDTGRLDASTFTVGNASDVPANGVEFMVIMPQEVTFTDVPDGCTTAQDGSQLECHWADVVLAAGQEWFPDGDRALNFAVSPDAPSGVRLDRNALVFFWQYRPDNDESDAVLTLQSTGSDKLPDDPALADADPVDESDDVGADNLAQFSVYTLDTRADLSVAVEPVSGTVGAVVRLEVTVTNNGPATAENGYAALVTLPGNARLTELPDGCFPAGDDGTAATCFVATDLAAGATSTLRLPVEITAAGTDDDTGTVAVTNDRTPDPVLDNNSVEFTVNGVDNRADLAITVADVDTVPGETAVLDLTVTNNGPAPAVGGYSVLVALPQYVSAELPAGCFAASDTGDAFTCGSATELGVGEQEVLTVAVVAEDVPADQQGTAAVLGRAPDPDDANNTAAFLVGVTDNRADLSVTVDDVVGTAGDTATVTATVVNDGPATADARLSLELPEQAVLTDAGDCVVTDGTVVCEAEGLEAGESRAFSITVELDEVDNPLPGSAVVVSAQPDPETGDNMAQFEVTVSPSEPDNPDPGPGADPVPGDDSGNPMLPVTGSSLTTVIAVGVAALAAAVALLLLTRDRRPRRVGAHR